MTLKERNESMKMKALFLSTKSHSRAEVGVQTFHFDQFVIKNEEQLLSVIHIPKPRI